MSLEHLSPVKSYRAGEAIGAYVAVKKDGITDNIKIAGPADTAIGITIANVAEGEMIGVRLLNAGGTCFLKTGGVIAKNATVRLGAGGKGLANGTGAILGSADVASGGDGEVIELLIGLPGGAAAAGAAQAAVAGTSTDGVAAGAADLAALKVEAEKIGDDVRATIVLANGLRTALIARGIITGAA